MACERGGYRTRQPEATVLHHAVREGWPVVEAEASERGGLPKRVRESVRQYLECGVARYGFVHVKCAACSDSTLVAFSCKQRGWCPSCGARRAEITAAHCGSILPHVAYRQWTLSMPHKLRWPLLKTPGLLRRVERRLVRAVWRWQRQEAKRLGVTGPLKGGAVGFTQLFGSMLQMTPHLHVLMPEGLWQGAMPVPLPPLAVGAAARYAASRLCV